MYSPADLDQLLKGAVDRRAERLDVAPVGNSCLSTLGDALRIELEFVIHLFIWARGTKSVQTERSVVVVSGYSQPNT